ncbi:hypothetical protein BTM25_22720 [Actinomadura rubteroloni]|uniref:Uncharacterized protein n=1 Tax=Actinomadura rubteroloni TaxID=1926885 RepID=A0A2P4US23_9ACTN|nr:hypothetical protein BTM25_22720 [Actinomadura rubteroloni]
MLAIGLVVLFNVNGVITRWAQSPEVPEKLRRLPPWRDRDLVRQRRITARMVGSMFVLAGVLGRSV